ncbi:MAG: DUF4189 domain-containing protein [Candidatus Obscuribacterales bacterium]|nr:DUF4189 domain-containing protein [Candidatus Obscuribacterales bacterium]
MALSIAALTFISSSAYAWTAVAYSKESGYLYTQYRASSAAEAEKGALEGCSKKALECELVGKAVDGPVAVVVAKGDGGMGKSTNIDPIVAAKNALKLCQEIAKNCRVVQAAWDGGTQWFTLARNGEIFYAAYNYDSREEAENDAIKGCEARAKEYSMPSGKCTLFHSSGKLLWYAKVSSNSYTSVYISHISANDATSTAKKGCVEGTKKGDTCVQISELENKGSMVEPATFKRLEAQIEAEEIALSKNSPITKTRPPIAKTERYTESCQNSSLLVWQNKQ